jgi:anti-sigma regulatory factor (Ser/Thr protein kinase)/anti-anti-sigma regulatory factor
MLDQRSRCDWTVEATFPVALIVLRGVLDATTVGAFGTALSKALSDRPNALVVDVAGLRCDDPIWLTRFLSTSRPAAEWPGAALLLAGAQGRFAELLATPELRRGIAVYPSRADALAATRRSPAPPQIRLALAASFCEPAHAREVALAALRRWQIPMELCHLIEVVVSELVTNAVRHARTPSELTMRISGRYLHVAVQDGSTAQPTAGLPADDLASGGRGMHIVAGVAHSWGIHTTVGGKVVWAAFRLHG